MTDTTPFQTRISKAILAEIRALAAEEERPIGTMVTRLLREALETRRNNQKREVTT